MIMLFGVRTKSGANRASGPPEHQYVMQVAHPNMELSLWRFDAKEAITYPIATATETTVETYRFVDRFGVELGMLIAKICRCSCRQGMFYNAKKWIHRLCARIRITVAN